MILKVWDIAGGWVYFDHVEKISIFSHDPLEEEEGRDYSGGTYATLKTMFNVATINRTWGHREEFIDVAFLEGYLLGDDGQTIERL